MAPVIRINLIPLREIRVASRRQLRGFFEAAAIAVTVIALVALSWRAWTTESELTAQLEPLGRTIAAGKLTAATAQRLQKQLDTHRPTLSMLQKIAGQTGATHEDVLWSVAMALPHGLWLTRLAFVGETLTLEGRAQDHARIAQFVRELEALPQFTDNELAEVRQEKEPSEDAPELFSIQARFVRPTGNTQAKKDAPE